MGLKGAYLPCIIVDDSFDNGFVDEPDVEDECAIGHGVVVSERLRVEQITLVQIGQDLKMGRYAAYDFKNGFQFSNGRIEMDGFQSESFACRTEVNVEHSIEFCARLAGRSRRLTLLLRVVDM